MNKTQKIWMAILSGVFIFFAILMYLNPNDYFSATLVVLSNFLLFNIFEKAIPISNKKISIRGWILYFLICLAFGIASSLVHSKWLLLPFAAMLIGGIEYWIRHAKNRFLFLKQH